MGRPLCALLTLHRWAVDAVRRERPAEPVRRILFLKLIEQGSTVLAYGALRRAVELVGRSNVYVCVFEENRFIVDLLEVIPPENVICIRADGWVRLAADTVRALRRCRQLEIDATIDLESFARVTAILAYLSGATRRVGLHRFTAEGSFRGDLLTHRVAHNPYLHTSTAFLSLVHALTVDPKEVPLLKVRVSELQSETAQIRPLEAACEAMRSMLERDAERTIDGPLVLLNPNASDRLPLRKWPAERFVELGRRVLAAHPDVVVAITGAPAERDGAENVRRGIDSPRALNVAGKTALSDLLALYSVADVLVTNDSGPAHFASLTAIDVVALFGPETPMLYGPIGPHCHVLWAGLACSPCLSAFNNRLSPCRNNRCMQEITVDQVYDVVVRCLATNAERLATRKNARLAVRPGG